MTDSTLNRFLAYGTNTQRLAFTPSVPTPASGPSPVYLWYETDTGNTYAYASGAWAQVNSGLASIADGDLIANISGSSAAPVANTLSAILDHVLGSAQGDILYRGASNWTVLAPGTSGQVLTTGGASANPSWAAASSGGVMTLISEVVTSASQASVTFSSISASYRDLLLVVRGRMTGAVTNQFVTLQFNSDTAANYNYERFEAFSTASAFSQSVGQTSGIAGELPGASATANYAGVSEIRIGDYRGTTFFKQWVARWSATTGTGTFSQGAGLHGGSWASTAAINAIKVAVSSGNFVDNSVVSLYGSN